MKNRPVEKMLHPSSMHDYCEMAAKFGFTPFDREPDFDQDAFRKQWNEIKQNVKKDSSFQRVRTKYPDLLLNSKGTSRISISKGGAAVYPECVPYLRFSRSARVRRHNAARGAARKDRPARDDDRPRAAPLTADKQRDTAARARDVLLHRPDVRRFIRRA